MKPNNGSRNCLNVLSTHPSSAYYFTAAKRLAIFVSDQIRSSAILMLMAIDIACSKSPSSACIAAMSTKARLPNPAPSTLWAFRTERLCLPL